jgi:hypothetical protein
MKAGPSIFTSSRILLAAFVPVNSRLYGVNVPASVSIAMLVLHRRKFS